jgi:cytochrome c oxidase assembly protein subunit 15
MQPKFLYRWSLTTLISIYLVIVAGGVVRMTGSGMGCPDWPKCFDQYIPPTSVDQLPENYKEIYAQKRATKIERFADFLTKLGFTQQAQELVNDPTLLEEQDFNAFNTWTEYINRLTGALAGLFIFLQLLFTFSIFKRTKLPMLLALILLCITLFQAWFGAMVVATNIVPWVLTIHMMLAIVMFTLQITLVYLFQKHAITYKKIGLSVVQRNTLLVTLSSALILMIVQTFWGTQVRQQIDELAHSLARNEWIEQLDYTYILHRSLAAILVIIAIIVGIINFKTKASWLTLYILSTLIVLEATVGKLFGWLDMAAWLQPTHLVLSMLLFGLLYYLFLRIIFQSKQHEIS